VLVSMKAYSNCKVYKVYKAARLGIEVLESMKAYFSYSPQILAAGVASIIHRGRACCCCVWRLLCQMLRS